MLKILQESEANHFDEIAMSDDSWFQSLDFSLKIFTPSRSDVVPRPREGVSRKKIVITLFFTGRKPIVLDALPKSRTSHQRYFIRHIFPDLKEENRRYQRRNPESTLWVRMDNSICHNGSKVESKFGKHRLFRMPHPPYSPHISLYDCWLFEMLKGIFKDLEFASSDEIDEAIPKTSLWMTCRACIAIGWAVSPGSLRTVESMFMNKMESTCSCLLTAEIGGAGEFFTPDRLKNQSLFNRQQFRSFVTSCFLGFRFLNRDGRSSHLTEAV
jgi:hypothetical protein